MDFYLLLGYGYDVEKLLLLMGILSLRLLSMVCCDYLLWLELWFDYLESVSSRVLIS